ncbi:hypothetical protein ACT7T5_002713 [Vibrio cholerae]
MPKVKYSEMAWDYLVSNPDIESNQLAQAVSMEKEACRNALRAWVNKGLVIRSGGKGTTKEPYRFRASEGAAPLFGGDARKGMHLRKRYKKTKRQMLWNNMKIEKVFTAHSIVAAIQSAVPSAYSYIGSLMKAGYVQLVFNGKKIKGQRTEKHRYTLIRDTGRLAPIVRKDGIWDLNEQKFYPFGHRSQTREVMHDMVG